MSSASNDYQRDLATIGGMVAKVVHHDNERLLLGATASSMRAKCRLPLSMMIQGGLLNDFARVSEASVRADGQVSDEEKHEILPLFAQFSGFLATVRSDYDRFRKLDIRALPMFLMHYKADEGPFGFQCEDTQWLGLDICRRVAEITNDREALELYTRAQIRQMDRLFEIGGLTDAESMTRRQLKSVIDLRGRLQGLPPPPPFDARVAAFCDVSGLPVFSAVAHAHQVWEHDPFDIERVHSEARHVFERLVRRAADAGHETTGRLLLLQGVSGAGKTHMMRAFRTFVHSEQLGFASYMQMTSRGEDYARYLLVHLIESLQKAYNPPEVESSGLMVLSDAIAECREAIEPDALRDLREGEFDLAKDDKVSPLVDRLLDLPRFADFDPDFLRVILYLQRRDSKLRGRVLKYLRCEPLAAYDRKMLGEISPPSDRDAPERMIHQLGRLMGMTRGGTMVMLVDQLEDVYHLDDAAVLVPRAFDVLRRVMEHLPNAVVVIACLRDMYKLVREKLTASVIDRLERDPPPIVLNSERSLEEIKAIVAIRLERLFAAANVRFHEDDPLFPFREEQLKALTNLRTRDILDWCRQFQEACIAAGKVVEWPIAGRQGHQEQTVSVVTLEQKWNDFRTTFSEAAPDDDEPMVELLARVGQAIGAESDPPVVFTVAREDGALIATQGRQSMLIGLCNRAPQGGHLQSQIEALATQAGRRPLVMVRCSEFPTNPRARITQKIGEIVRAGGRRVTIDDLDWRAMMAFFAFEATEGTNQDFLAWRRSERPLSQLRSLRGIFALDDLRKTGAHTAVGVHPPAGVDVRPEDREIASAVVSLPGISAPLETPVVASAEPAPNSPGSPTADALSAPRPLATPGATSTSANRASAAPQPLGPKFRIGRAGGVTGGPVELELPTLVTHAAFLGSTGSGKTTLALNIIEHALERGIPALLVDRKGDLCSYGRRAWWAAPGRTPEDTARKQALAKKVDVVVYTPGESAGRDLPLPFLPAALRDLPTQDRLAACRQAADAIASMIGYKSSPTDQAHVSILLKAIEVLGEVSSGPIHLRQLIDIIHDQDAALVNAIGHLNPRHFDRLVDNLEMIRITKGNLLNQEAAPLDATTLLGVGKSDQRTQLGIISTKFLRETSVIEFWVARMLADLARWASQNPSPKLQAIVMFDEADIYMPAMRKPATKEPMQDLLRRARSAGLAVFLATQSPGDLDYRSRDNIRTWFVGRVAEARAVEKMQPLLSECRINVQGRLARQNAGEFFILDGGRATELRADRALMETHQLSEEEIRDVAATPPQSPLRPQP